jgi:L-fuconolactonase
MKLIDTHIHVWDLEKVDYSWLKGDASVLSRTYELGELEGVRKKVGVTEGILVQAANNREDTEWMLKAAGSVDWITGVVGWLPLMDVEGTRRILEKEWGGLLKGVRHLIHNEGDPKWLLRGQVLESLGMLAERDIPYDVVGIVPEHLRTALEVSSRVPGLRMVLDHLNQPPAEIPGSEWEGLMKEAAKNRNIYVKISGLGRLEDVEPCIGFVLEQFGEDRCFCGGDWPVALLAGSYEGIWERYLRVVGGSEKVLYENAKRFYAI